MLFKYTPYADVEDLKIEDFECGSNLWRLLHTRVWNAVNLEEGL